MDRGPSVPKTLRCKYCCHAPMKLAWPGLSDRSKGNIMCCDECWATCQADGRKNWDWKPGEKDQ